MIDFWLLNHLQKNWRIPWDLSLFALLLSVVITEVHGGLTPLQTHIDYQAESGRPCTALLFICCYSTKEFAQLLCSLLWRRWKLEGLIISYPRFGFRKMRHYSFRARGTHFQLVMFSCQLRTHRMCSQQWEITGILGIRAICLIWPWVVEAPWCLIKRSSLSLRVFFQ